MYKKEFDNWDYKIYLLRELMSFQIITTRSDLNVYLEDDNRDTKLNPKNTFIILKL